MPATYTTPTTKYAGLKIIRASRAALQAAVEWLVEELKQDVSIGAHSDTASHGSQQHSKPGQIPFIQTGDGRNSIAYQMVANGALVGGTAIGDTDIDGEGNYLTWWDLSHEGDSNQRPWLSNWRERHETGFMAVYRMALKDEMAKN